MSLAACVSTLAHQIAVVWGGSGILGGGAALDEGSRPIDVKGDGHNGGS